VRCGRSCKNQRVAPAVLLGQQFDQVGLRQHHARLQDDGFAEVHQRLVVFTQLGEHVAEVVVGKCVVGPECHGAAIAGPGLGEIAQGGVAVAQRQHAVVIQLVLLEQRSKQGHGVRRLAAQVQEIGQRCMGFGFLRCKCHCALKGGLDAVDAGLALLGEAFGLQQCCNKSDVIVLHGVGGRLVGTQEESDGTAPPHGLSVEVHRATGGADPGTFSGACPGGQPGQADNRQLDGAAPSKRGTEPASRAGARLSAGLRCSSMTGGGVLQLLLSVRQTDSRRLSANRSA